AGGLVDVGAPEAPGVVVGGSAHHAGVPVAPGAAEEAVVGDPQGGARGGELGDPVAAELVGLVGGETRQGRDVNLALLAQRAGHQGDVHPGGRVVRHGGAGPDRLVVRMGVNQQDSVHPATVM